MALHYKDIKNERQWRATIGLSSAKFYSLVALFKASYEALYGVSLEQGAARQGKQMKLETYEDCLFYVLFELKNGLTYDVLGFLIGVDSSHARKLFEKYQKILEITLFKAGQLPKRNFATLEEFRALLEAESEIILDVTEVGIQRSSDYEEQKKDYSGKKKAYPQNLDSDH